MIEILEFLTRKDPSMKPFWKSKTIWANAIALAGLLVNHASGNAIPPDVAAVILAALNVALRLITSTGVSLT